MLKKRIIRAALSIVAVTGFASTTLLAQQPGDTLRGEVPELSAIFNSFRVSQSAMYTQVAANNDSPGAADGRNKLSAALKMQAEMKMGHSMHMGGSNMSGMSMGPFGMLEKKTMTELISLVQAKHDSSEARAAYSGVDALTTNVVGVLKRGQAFEDTLFDIYSDAGIGNKKEAVAKAISDYQQAGQLSVPVQPKDSGLLEEHAYASAFRTGYPELNGFNWTTQWLTFASLEALLQKENNYNNNNNNRGDGVSITIDRFKSKVSGMQGIMASPIPIEMPMAPVISPLLYYVHPEAAIILDNLNMFEIVIADILAHPGVENRQTAMAWAVEEFTNDETNVVMDQNYLLWAMRGGLFNQGGPALGEELMHSQRNRSRSEMDMRHAMIMSTP